MKKMSRMTAVFLEIMTALAAVAGCAQENGGTGAVAENTPAVSTGTAAEPEAPVTLTWKPQNDAPQDPDSPITKEIEKRFNIKLEYVYLERAKEAELLNLRIATGNVPDVMFSSIAYMQQFVNDGAITEIPVDTFKKFAPQLYDLTLKIGGENVYEYFSMDGKLYGMPYLSPDGKYGFVPLWRDDWLKNVGIGKVPETLDEAAEAFYKFVNDDPDKNGEKDTYALSDKGIYAIYGAFGALGNNPCWIKDGNGGVILSGAVPAMKDALTVLNKWYKDGLIDPEFISGENKGQYWANSVTFWNGKIGFTVPGTYYHVNPPLYDGNKGSDFFQTFKELQGEAATYSEGPAVKGPAGKSGLPRFAYLGGACMMFGKDCAKEPKKLEKAMQIFEALNTDEEFYKLCRYGREGVEYDMVDGYPVTREEVKSAGIPNKLALGANGICQLQNNHEMMKKIGTRPEVVAYADKYAATPDYLNEVFVSLPSYPQYKANIDKKIEENYALFITGQRSLTEWDKFIEEINKEGLAQLTTEANEWYKKANQ